MLRKILKTVKNRVFLDEEKTRQEFFKSYVLIQINSVQTRERNNKISTTQTNFYGPSTV